MAAGSGRILVHDNETAGSTITKRTMLSQTAQLFDPLGWLAPVIVRAKILFQSTWLRELEWDDPLPDNDAVAWRNFLDDLPTLSGI